MCQITPCTTLLLSVLTLGLVGLAPNALAADELASRSCIKCHKRNGQLEGIHASPGLAILCQDCHGPKGSHPKKGSTIMTFGPDSPFSAQQRGAVCLTCHDHQALGEVEWTHNVHANRLGCDQCHRLHPEADPMLSLDTQQHSQLCIGCHQVEQ
ncbi:cytochrome c3 family protein [Shewanella aquimarina]|uniref:cytochrome c3 family protein n=1 Tax=Shewanella aquimarina TaxID=260365 RepID=UPI002014D2A7|nr:cytochrome c3 family protein [Shewanella aquimarina]MCL2909641.1 cytochrome c3 family protein [Shewanella aquimarina]